MNIGIIGQGFVGGAVKEKFKDLFTIYTYDIKKSLSNSSLEYIKKNCNVIFICVPTPMNSDGSCNVTNVEKVINSFSDVENKILINKSTVIPGTTDNLQKSNTKNKIIFNPEFLTEKNAVNDYKNQNRIILGGTESAINSVENIFTKVFPKASIIKTDAIYAEMVKYFTNSFLATKVSFANEMFNLCKKLNIDYQKVVEISLEDKRIGKSHLKVPGHDGDFGFGGHCFPKDLSAFIKLTEKHNSINNVLKAVKLTNDKVRKNRDWEKMKGRAVN